MAEAEIWDSWISPSILSRRQFNVLPINVETKYQTQIEESAHVIILVGKLRNKHLKILQLVWEYNGMEWKHQ